MLFSTARTLMIWLAIAAAMALLALISPVSIDEGQYVAPAALARGARPFVDYLTLQTPLQAELVGALGRFAPGWTFVGLRIVTGLIGAGVLGLTFLAQRLAGAAPRRAALGTALLAASYSFLFGCAVVRNDALPALLATGAIAAMLAGLAGRLPRAAAFGAAGLLLGLAASAKISYALPAAGAGGFLLIELARRRDRLPALVAYGVGGMIGVLPCLLAWRAAPEAFTYGVFTFASTTPLPWRASRGEAWMVGFPANLVITAGVLMLGPALGALIRVSADEARRGWRRLANEPSLLLLDALILAGLVAALLPTPTNFQYALPALPPLFVRLGLTRPTPAPIARALMATGAALGVGYAALFIGAERIATGDWPSLALTRESHWIGEKMRAAGAAGPIATLRPELALDSGFPLDPRFATGPFVFRTAGAMPAAELGRLKAVGPQMLGAALDAAPPAALVVGGVARFDPLLRQAADARGWPCARGPDRRYALCIRPLRAGG